MEKTSSKPVMPALVIKPEKNDAFFNKQRPTTKDVMARFDSRTQNPAWKQVKK